LEKSAHIYEMELLNKDQTSVWVLVSTNPMFKSTGEYLGAISIMTDISSRKGIEKSLMETIIEKDRDFFMVIGNMVEAMKPLIQNTKHNPFEYDTKFT